MHPPDPSQWPPRRYFFDQGLRFECRRCGRCCTGDPGIVFVAPDDLPPLAEALELSVAEMVSSCLTPWKAGYTVRETADGRCLFYDGGCRVYAVRPNQCRSWPFWLKNLRHPARWERAAQSCPGMNRGRLHSRAEILGHLSAP